jgi:hypothetical protein
MRCLYLPFYYYPHIQKQMKYFYRKYFWQQSIVGKNNLIKEASIKEALNLPISIFSWLKNKKDKAYFAIKVVYLVASSGSEASFIPHC